MSRVTVIGAGLAGCEAAWQLAERGIQVALHEMKPERMTPAHHSPDFAELVCSNSLRSNELTNASGLLKEELRRLGGLVVRCADETQVEAGGALAVDREAFARRVTEQIRSHPNITVVPGEVTELPAQGEVIVATGPLTSDALFEAIHARVGGEFLHFFDAAAPIVTFESIDMEHAYFASRYDKGTPDYINCPFTREEFDAFWEALTTAEEAEVHGFEDKLVFAVLQLRRDNAQGSLYNLVGCQTHLKWGEQKRIFSMIPALRNAEFVRYGVMHRNTFLDSPRLLDHNFALRAEPRIRFAGQMTGVEGYMESNASGFLAGLATAHKILGKAAPDFPSTTAIGALGRYISNETVAKFQPMNINFGIIDPLGYKIRGKREKNAKISERALDVIDTIKKELELS